MADIELIVKIPEEKIAIEYGEVISIGRNNDKELADYIFAGTPLPKGHGRLIDADATLKKHCVDFCKEKPSCYEDCGIYDLFHLAPTIIEADKGDKE